MLLDDIIDILSDENGSLNNALLKTKVLLHTIGKKDLVPWVDHELKGYPDDDGVPEYRSVEAYVYGLVQSFRTIHRHYLVPLMHLDDDLRKRLTEFKLLMPIDQIQQAVAQHRAGSTMTLGKPIPPEVCAILSRGLDSAHVISATSELNMNQADKILQEVRSRLLEFMLELRDVVGVEATNKDLASKANEFDADKAFTKILGHATFGPNATVFIGNQNAQLNVTNRKGDIDGLLTELEKNGIPGQQLDELKTAIKTDEKEGKEVSITNEGHTSKWYMKALKEGGKGVYKAGVAVISQVIIKAIEHYSKGG
jgi:AbiTii